MKDFKGKTAVITGAASGIGLGLAQHAAREGMNIVAADINSEILADAVKQLAPAEVLSVECDVSQPKQVEQLKQEAFDRFGAVHLLCNNAGVSGGASIAETSLEDWGWVLAVNLMGPIHVLHYFVPAMMKQDHGHIVNTASIAGLLSVPGMAPYNVSKHGVVTLSETLHSELHNAGSSLGVSVLCPSFVRTNIHHSERNRPSEWSAHHSREEQLAMEEGAMAVYDAIFRGAMPPETVAELVFGAVRKRQFYILTHPAGSKSGIEKRMRTILDDGVPSVKDPGVFPTEW